MEQRTKDMGVKKDLENLEEVLDPSLWGRLISKAWIILVMIFVFGAATIISLTVLFETPPPPPIDKAWFIAKQQEIIGLDAEIKAAEEAFQRHQDDVKARSGIFSISRDSDRRETERLNRAIVELMVKRMHLIRDFNTERFKWQGDVTGLPEPINGQ